jgi:hypothetical protein
MVIELPLPVFEEFAWEVCVSKEPDGEPLAKWPIYTGVAKTLGEAIRQTWGQPGAQRRVWGVLPTGRRILVWHDPNRS